MVLEEIAQVGVPHEAVPKSPSQGILGVVLLARAISEAQGANTYLMIQLKSHVLQDPLQRDSERGIVR